MTTGCAQVFHDSPSLWLWENKIACNLSADVRIQVGINTFKEKLVADYYQ